MCQRSDVGGRAGGHGRREMPPADQGRPAFPLPEVRYYKTPKLPAAFRFQ